MQGVQRARPNRSRNDATKAVGRVFWEIVTELEVVEFYEMEVVGCRRRQGQIATVATRSTKDGWVGEPVELAGEQLAAESAFAGREWLKAEVARTVLTEPERNERNSKRPAR